MNRNYGHVSKVKTLAKANLKTIDVTKACINQLVQSALGKQSFRNGKRHDKGQGNRQGIQFEETALQGRWNVGWGNGPRNRYNRLLETGSLGNIHLWVFLKDCMYLYWSMEASIGLN